MSTNKLDNIKQVVRLMLDGNSTNVTIIQRTLDVPMKLFEDTNIDETLKKIAHILDFNGDGKYTAEDFELLGKEISKGNLSLYVQIFSTLSGLVYSAIQFSKLKLSSDDVIDITIKLVIYSVLIPIMNTKNISEWANQKTGDVTNIDSLFNLLEQVYMFLTTAECVKDAANNVISFIKKSCMLCCGKNMQDKAEIKANENLIITKSTVLDVMKIKMRNKLPTSILISTPSTTLVPPPPPPPPPPALVPSHSSNIITSESEIQITIPKPESPIKML